MTDDASPPGRANPEPGPSPAQSPPPPPGHPQQAWPQQAYPQQAWPQQAYPQQAWPQQAYPQQAWPQQAYPQPPAFIGGEQRHRPLAIVVAIVAGLVSISMIAVTGIVLAHRVRVPRSIVTTSTPTPAVATPTPPTPTPIGTTTGPAKTAAGPGGEHTVASVALSKGDCIKTLPKGQTITTITLVTCTTPHEAQVGATFSPAGSAYLGSTTYERLIARECPARLQEVITRDAPPLSWMGFYPELKEWTSGDRSIKCLLIPSDGKPLRRSVVA